MYSLCALGANLKGVDMEDSQMTGINLRVATLKNAKLKNCNLRGATLAGTDLEVSQPCWFCGMWPHSSYYNSAKTDTNVFFHVCAELRSLRLRSTGSQPAWFKCERSHLWGDADSTAHVPKCEITNYISPCPATSPASYSQLSLTPTPLFVSRSCETVCNTSTWFAHPFSLSFTLMH